MIYSFANYFRNTGGLHLQHTSYANKTWAANYQKVSNAAFPRPITHIMPRRNERPKRVISACEILIFCENNLLASDITSQPCCNAPFSKSFWELWDIVACVKLVHTGYFLCHVRHHVQVVFKRSDMSDKVSHIKPTNAGHFQFHVRYALCGPHIWRILPVHTLRNKSRISQNIIATHIVLSFLTSTSRAQKHPHGGDAKHKLSV